MKKMNVTSQKNVNGGGLFDPIVCSRCGATICKNWYPGWSYAVKFHNRLHAKGL